MKTTTHQFSKFLLAGGVAAAANFSSRYFLGFYMQYVPSIIFAYLIGMVTAYVICRLFVFESQKNSMFQQISYFTIINIFAVSQTIVVSLLFSDYVLIIINNLSLRESIAHFIGICVPIFTSYLGHKYVTFK